MSANAEENAERASRAATFCTLPTPPLTLLGVPFLGVLPLPCFLLSAPFLPGLGPFLFFLLSCFSFLAMSAKGMSRSIAKQRELLPDAS